MGYYGALWSLLKVNKYRAREIGKILKEIFNENNLNAIIEMDPQYKALRKIYLSTRDKGLSVIITIANSLISYQLSGKGEDYWNEVGNFFAKTEISDYNRLYDLFTDFLIKHTKYNRIQIRNKLRRLRIFLTSRIIDMLYTSPCLYSIDQYMLLKMLSVIMKQPMYAKTIVFSIKMYYYGAHIMCENTVPDPRIPMPIDRRVAYISFTSGLIETSDKIRLEDLRNLVHKFMQSRYRHDIIEAWFILSKYSGIPCILLDTIVWLMGRYISPFKKIDEMAKEFISDYGLILSLDSIREIFAQFAYAFASHS